AAAAGGAAVGGGAAEGGEQVGAEVLHPRQRPPRPRQADEDVLNGVLGVLARAEQGPGGAEEGGREAVVQRGEGVLAPLGEARQQGVACSLAHPSLRARR